MVRAIVAAAAMPAVRVLAAAAGHRVARTAGLLHGVVRPVVLAAAVPATAVVAGRVVLAPAVTRVLLKLREQPVLRRQAGIAGGACRGGGCLRRSKHGESEKGCERRRLE